MIWGGFIFNLMLVLPVCSLCFPSNGWVFGFSTTDVFGFFFLTSRLWMSCLEILEAECDLKLLNTMFYRRNIPKNPDMSIRKGLGPLHSYSFRMGLEPEKSQSRVWILRAYNTAYTNSSFWLASGKWKLIVTNKCDIVICIPTDPGSPNVRG